MSTSKQMRTILNNLVAYYGPQHWWEDGDLVTQWVTMILIQQATAQNVEKALNNLAPYLTFEKLTQLTVDRLARLIRPAGFYHQKTQAIRAMLAWWAQFDNNVTQLSQMDTAVLRKSLLTVRGVGQETADVMLLYLFKRPVFIADQYAIRLFNRLGLGPFKNYDDLRKHTLPLLTMGDSYEQIREWHAVIDEHGKRFRKNPELDETFLQS